jgi:hypothetical protein
MSSSTPNVKSSTFDGALHEIPVSMPAPSNPSFSPTNLAVEPPAEAMPSISPVQNKLVEAWDAIKDDPTTSDTNRGLNTVGVSSIPGVLFCYMLSFPL